MSAPCLDRNDEEICSVDRLRRGLCGKHYMRRKRQDDLPRPIKLKHPQDADEILRFYGWTEAPSGCWEWRGFTSSEGYGKVQYRKRKYPVHRLAYETWVGPIPEGHVVRHKCDNPPCINPDHLETGTQAENMRDMVNRGRSLRRFTPDMEQSIRDAYYVNATPGTKLAEDYGVGTTLIYRTLKMGRTR